MARRADPGRVGAAQSEGRLIALRVLGHSSAAMTLDLYGHLMPGRADCVAQRLDELVRRGMDAG